MTIVLPEGWQRPKGYSTGLVADGFVFVSGQVGWDAAGRLATDFVGQVRLALENVVAVLRAAGSEPSRIVRLTWYVTDVAAYRAQQAQIGEVYRAAIGRHYPPMSVIGIAQLVEERALVEIEATATVPPHHDGEHDGHR